MGYTFPPEIQSQINNFRQSAEITSLVDEISILRMLLQQETTKQNPRLAMDLIGQIGKLSKLIDQQHERESLVIHRDRLANLAAQLIESLIVEFKGATPDWEERIDRVAERFGTLLIPTDQPEQD